MKTCWKAPSSFRLFTLYEIGYLKFYWPKILFPLVREVSIVGVRGGALWESCFSGNFLLRRCILSIVVSRWFMAKDFTRVIYFPLLLKKRCSILVGAQPRNSGDSQLVRLICHLYGSLILFLGVHFSRCSFS